MFNYENLAQLVAKRMHAQPTYRPTTLIARLAVRRIREVIRLAEKNPAEVPTLWRLYTTNPTENDIQRTLEYADHAQMEADAAEQHTDAMTVWSGNVEF